MESISPSSYKMITSPGFFTSTKQEFVCLLYRAVDNLNAPSLQWLRVIVDAALWASPSPPFQSGEQEPSPFHLFDSSPSFLLTPPRCESN